MITLFRRIRQKLIDSGSVTKYLIYAIGEVLLVVVGILIALQVNNWNEQRKNNRELTDLTNSLIEELVQDTLLLDNTISTFQNMYEYNNGLLNRIFNDAATIDTIKQIAFYEYDPGIRGAIENYNSVTISILQSTGKIALFDDDAKSAIIRHANSLSTKFVDRNADLYVEKLNAYSDKYAFFVTPGTEYYLVLKNTMQIDDERDFISKFSGMVGFKDYTLSRYLEIYTETKESTVSLIELLKESN